MNEQNIVEAEVFASGSIFSGIEHQPEEFKVFYILTGRESIHSYTFKGEAAKEWVQKYGYENGVFDEHVVINHRRKYENAKS